MLWNNWKSIKVNCLDNSSLLINNNFKDLKESTEGIIGLGGVLLKMILYSVELYPSS